MAEQKHRRVQLRMKKTDYTCLYKLAERKNMNISEYIRTLILEECKRIYNP